MQKLVVPGHAAGVIELDAPIADNLSRIAVATDRVSGDNVFFAATGVTDGALLRGVRVESHRIVTQSLSMRSRSGTIRLIEGRHDPERSVLVNR